MTFRYCSVLLALLFSAPVAFAQQVPDESRIDRIFARYDQNTPGCAAALYQNGEITFAKGYGMANIEHGIPNSPQTVFRIASASKQFAAVAIAILAEDGQLSLEDDIRKFFPELQDYGHTIRVRHLVYHQSGLRDYLDLAWLAEWGDAYGMDDVMEMMSRQKGINFEPGTEYAYSNSGYVMTALIVEKVTGQSLREWSETHMFAPLGMENTHWHDDHSHIVPNRAYGYRRKDMDDYQTSLTTLDVVGDGALMTTVEDLLRWDNNFYDNRLGKGNPELIKLIETPGRFKDLTEGDYGFGLTIDEYEGTPEIWHDGSWYGVASSIHRYPEYRTGISVLCNDEDADATRYARSIAYEVIPQLPNDGVLESVTTYLGSDEVYSEDVLAAYVGRYYSTEVDGDLDFVVSEGELQLDRRSGLIVLGAPKGKPDTFGDGYFRYVFERDENGNVISVEVRSDRMYDLRFVRRQ